MGVMVSYCLYFLVMVVSAKSLKAIPQFRRHSFNRDIRILFSFLVIFSLSAFRYFNNDMKGYAFYLFDNYVLPASSLQSLLQSKNYLEPIYWALYYLSKILTGRVWLFVIMTSFIMCFFYYEAIIYEEKTNNVDMMLMLLFSSLFMGFYSGLRQGMACAVFAFSIRYIIERKPVKYLFWVFIAGCIHKSGFLLIVFYPLINIRLKGVYKYMAMILVFCVLLTSGSVLGLLGDDYSVTQSVSGIMDMIVSMMLDVPFLVLYIILYPKMKRYLPNIEAYMLLYVTSFAITFSSSVLSIGRINWYLGFANVVLLPVSIRVLAEGMKPQSKRILKLLFFLYCAFYLYRTAVSWRCLPYQTWLQFL